MKTKAAVLYEVGQPLVIEEVELDDPKEGEVLVKNGAAGICRSDRHFMHGDAPIALPVVLGHEGAGTVEKVGTGVTSVRPGQQVILSFVPSCGRCKSCIEGHGNVCDSHGATGPFMYDGTRRLHKGDQYIHHMGKVACFSEYSVVPEAGCIPTTSPIPMDKAAMIGCCVPTGVGASSIQPTSNPAAPSPL
jgi:S-(hydroxymethyl)glutathione dehydrogenase/alcohol dehydrogenase